MKNIENMELEIEMISYAQAKRDLTLKVQTLEETINFLKQNSFYEDYCKNCHNIMKVNLRRYGEKKKFCTNKCRNEHFEKRKKSKNV